VSYGFLCTFYDWIVVRVIFLSWDLWFFGFFVFFIFFGGCFSLAWFFVCTLFSLYLRVLLTPFNFMWLLLTFVIGTSIPCTPFSYFLIYWFFHLKKNDWSYRIWLKVFPTLLNSELDPTKISTSMGSSQRMPYSWPVGMARKILQRYLWNGDQVSYQD
jgi:predicted membrane protein